MVAPSGPVIALRVEAGAGGADAEDVVAAVASHNAAATTAPAQVIALAFAISASYPPGELGDALQILALPGSAWVEVEPTAVEQDRGLEGEVGEVGDAL